MWVTDQDVADDPVVHEREQQISGFINAGLGKTQRCAPFALVDPGAFDDGHLRLRELDVIQFELTGQWISHIVNPSYG